MSVSCKNYSVILLDRACFHLKLVYHIGHRWNRRDGVVVRASASQSVDLGFISLVQSYQKTLKNGIRSSLLGARHIGEIVENKPASSFVVSLGKALNGTPHLYVEDRWPIYLQKGNSQASADLPSKT